MSTRTLEDVAGVGEGPRIFQLYLLSDRGKISELIERARAAKYDALAITVDVVAHGNRERDLRTGFQVPPKLTLASWLNFALYPRWSLPAMRLKFQMANFPPAPNEDPKTMTARMFTRSFTWDDARWVVEQWGGPVLLKGVSSPADCQRAADIGIAGIMIGNHGGRQLDSNVAPLHQLPRIRDKVGDKLKLVVDGGVRRGTDMVKALALGADMCSIGRPYLYGLAAFGEAGVARAIEIFRSEFERDMTHMGCNKVSDIKAEHVVPSGRP
jgi:L-lactate dehydrogenase (cytochrome)